MSPLGKLAAIVTLGMTVAKAVVAANPHVVVDSSFGTDGVATIAYASTTALTPDGKILALGQDEETKVLYRYTRNGTPDPAFGTNGAIRLLAHGSPLAPVSFSSLLVAPDGRFYVAAFATEPCKVNVLCNGSVMSRYLASGELDTSFGTNGFAHLSIGQYDPSGQDVRLALDPDGSIVAAENSYTRGPNHLFPVTVQTRIERFDTSGTSLASWPLAAVCGHGAYGLNVQSDGGILVTVLPTAGSLAQTKCMSRYARNGALDTSFGVGGAVDWAAVMGTDPQLWYTTVGMLVSMDSKVTLAASATPAEAETVGKLARFLPSGQLAAAFGVPNGSGIAPANIRALAASCGGKIVGAALGHDSFYKYVGLTRYNSNGSLDLTASGTPDGVVSQFISFLGEVSNVLVRDDGVVIVQALGRVGDAGSYVNVLVAYRQLDCQHPYDTALLPVVEYHNPSLDHYFMSPAAADMIALDSGRHAGWQRTGYTFASAFTVMNPVCRFYIPPPYGDSHFFSASQVECGEVQTTFPQFVLETADAFRAAVPDTATGACPASAAVPVYRIWDKRADTNHRYTTDRQVRDAMVAKGWVAEGYGPDAVAMCAPQQ